MQNLVLTIVGAALLGTIAYAVQRKFGPEWTKTGDVYSRKVVVDVTHYPAGNVSNYHLPLESGELYVCENDEHSFLDFGVRAHGGIGVTKDEKGRVTKYVVSIGEMTHIDFNGDVLFDARCGSETRRPEILFEGQYVEVCNTKDLFRAPEAVAPDGRAFLFEGIAWTVKQAVQGPPPPR